MSVLAKGPDNQDIIFAKGAPESVLQKCSHVSALPRKAILLLSAVAFKLLTECRDSESKAS